MDNRLLFIFLFAFSSVKCDESTIKTDTVSINGTNVKDKQNSATEATDIVAPKLLDLCSVCNCTGDIVNCDDRNISFSFNETQWPSTRISVMSFEGNSLEHIQAFPNVVIERLIFRGNKIKKIVNAAFKQIINLTELDLSHNELSTENLQPHAFEGKFSSKFYEPLENLTLLNLAYNKLYSLHQDLFEHMSNLKILNLSHNLLTQIDLRTSLAISSIQQLEELDLSYCGLKMLQSFQFYTSKYLKKLNLSGNQLTIPPAALGEAAALEYLCLDNNPIQFVNHLQPFPNMSSLKEMSFCYMPHLTVIGPGSFSGMDSLEHLRIQNCPRLETIDEAAFTFQAKQTKETVWPPLKKLDLSDNALRYLPQYLLVRWDWLEELDLMNNKWSCDCDNQYLIGELLPKYGKKLMGDNVKGLTCASPPEHKGKNLTSLSHRKLRCRDLYGARPEKDATILIGVMIGLFLAIPVCLTGFILWRRGFFFYGTQGPASFSRAFYKRTSNDEEI
ncbi:podocan [Ptiloglossa arizonensis]|uniref:podocan n=1 Tax=Ptiloglossa arizonensis TaxID=3350558 RepID=UPI003FA09986